MAQMGAHASSPLGHAPSTQSCAEPGSPVTPAQSHCQQPQSLDSVQALPGDVEPGWRPLWSLEHPAASTSATAAMKKEREPTSTTLLEAPAKGQSSPGPQRVSAASSTGSSAGGS